MKVFLTGATSLLGRTVTQQLLLRGVAVTTYQRSGSGLDTNEVLGDIRNREQVLAASRGHDAVIHLAALVAPRPKWSEAHSINVDGTANARAAAEHCGRFVHISSPSVAFTGAPSMGATSEVASYSGRDRYTATKVLAERLVLDHPRVPTVVVRPHLVWGPGDEQLVDRIISRALQGRLALPDHGRALVDSTYVDDAAAAILAALDATAHDGPALGRAWTVTGNDPRSVTELVQGILRAAGITKRVRSVPAPVAKRLGTFLEHTWPGSEPPLTAFAAQQLSMAHWFDQREVQNVLHWTPLVSVEAGLQRLAASFK
jgi:nucleoside-diphosphate-sugar epimerase